MIITRSSNEEFKKKKFDNLIYLRLNSYKYRYKVNRPYLRFYLSTIKYEVSCIYNKNNKLYSYNKEIKLKQD